MIWSRSLCQKLLKMWFQSYKLFEMFKLVSLNQFNGKYFNGHLLRHKFALWFRIFYLRFVNVQYAGVLFVSMLSSYFKQSTNLIAAVNVLFRCAFETNKFKQFEYFSVVRRAVTVATVATAFFLWKCFAPVWRARAQIAFVQWKSRQL